MTSRSGELGRRAFLALLMSSAATSALAQPGPVAVPAAGRCAHPDPAPPRLSFAGEDRVLLLVQDAAIEEPPARPISMGAPVRWKPDPNSRTGGVGSLDGVEGAFSGRQHVLAPQLFRPWPKPVAGARLPIFDPPRSGSGGRAPADDPGTWTVAVDGAPVGVVSVHRKTVPVKTVRTDPRGFASARRHLVTLTLDRVVPGGAAVTVAAPGIADVSATRSDSLQSELVHACQTGYALGGPKKGYAGAWLGVDAAGRPGSSDDVLAEGQPWRLVEDDTGSPVAEGTLVLAKAGDEVHFDKLNFNLCDIYEADFSSVRRPGTYRLEIAGAGASFPFPIAENPYAEVFRLAARWYFHQRSGCEIAAPHGEGRTRPRNGHPEDGLMVWQTGVKLGRTSEGFRREPSAPDLMQEQPAEDAPGATANPDAWGGWHDAGDWDRRVQHLDVVWLMADLVENHAAARQLDMNIPESGRSFADPAIAARKAPDDRGDGATVLPDLIHEALWGISLWRRTQTPEGGIIGGVEYSSDGITGSVSWNPIQRAYAYAPEEWSAYHFAMAAAKLGHVIEVTCGDAVLGQALKAEAEAAWAWAEAELAAGSTGDDEAVALAVARARMRAGASLYRATGNRAARDAFDNDNVFAPKSGEDPQSPGRAVVATYSLDYVRAGREGREIDAEVAGAITGWCASRLEREERIGADYGLHNTELYPWGAGWYRFGPGSNWRAAHAAQHLAVTGEAAPLTAMVIEGLWFALGCNPSNATFIQGVGARAFADALLVDQIDSCAIPGQPCFGVAGGALRRWERDGIADALYPDEEAWPRYARIFESSRVVKCAEHGMTSVAREWLQATALANDLLARHCDAEAADCTPDGGAPT